MKISIITVCFNETENLLITLQNISYLKKSIPFEYVLVDGDSKKETIEIIHRYERNIDVFVSEIDEGLFDAMNKGVTLSTGEYINFLNCGDTLSLSGLLKLINYHNRPPSNKPDVYYLDTLISYGKISIKQPIWSLDKFYKGMPFCHQSSFVKRKHLEDFSFDKHSLCSDFKFFVNLFLQGARFQYIPEIGSTYKSGGVSEKQLKTSLLQKKIFLINLRHWDKNIVEEYYRYKLMKSQLRLIMKRILGERRFRSFESMIQKYRYGKS